MKKDKTLIITVVMLMATLSSLPSLALNNNSVSHVISYSGAPVIGTDTLGGVTYSTVTYSDLYNGGEPGMPSLPIDYIRFSVPYNATNFTVTATVNRWTNQYLDHLLYPCQRPLYGDGSDSLTITLPDSSAYYSGEYYPSQLAWVADEGYLAGENHIVTVAVMPLRYSHTSTSDILSRAIRCNLTLRFDLSDNLSMYPIVRNDSLLREEGYELAQSMVVNPDQVKNFAPSSSFASGIDPIGGIIQGGIGGNILNGGGDTPIQDTTEINDLIINYPYLIVTTSELKHSIRRIAALKRQKGYNVKVVTMDEVLSSIFSGHGDVVGEGANAHLTFTDNAGKLRQFIRNYYKYYGTQYVLLAGDIPYNYAKMIEPLSSNDSIIIPSDMYFADLNGNWQDNLIDYQSELYIGRIIAKNEKQISNYTDKLFRYIMNPGNGDFGYLKRVLYSAGYDFLLSSELFSVSSKLNLIFPNNTVLSESLNIDDKSKFPSGDDIIDSFNDNKYGFISLHHHGFPNGLITYGLRDQHKYDYYRFLWALDSVHTFAEDNISGNDDHSTTNALNNLNNHNYPCICYSTACSTMPFDEMTAYEGIPMNFGESFTTGKNYGGPAFIGNTRKGFTPFAGSLERAFAEKLNQGYYQIGIANALAKSFTSAYTISDRYTAINQNLLGDPEIEVWTDEPEKYENIVVVRTDNSVSISGLNAGATIVGYISTQRIPIRKIVMTENVTLNDASLGCPIMLYEHNYLPFVLPLLLQNETINRSDYVVASDMIAGKMIDPNRTNGNVIIHAGIEYEVEASGTVILENGFKVEKGAMFAVYPSSF